MGYDEVEGRVAGVAYNADAFGGHWEAFHSPSDILEEDPSYPAHMDGLDTYVEGGQLDIFAADAYEVDQEEE